MIAFIITVGKILYYLPVHLNLSRLYLPSFKQRVATISVKDCPFWIFLTKDESE